jgi:hypothetical protein
MIRGIVSSCILAVVAAGAVGQTSQPLNDQTFAALRDRIRPKGDELCFETVPWLPTFWEGVMEGQKQDKPILLWAMNGHPLACT